MMRRGDYKAFSLMGPFSTFFSCVIIEVNDSERSESMEKIFWQGGEGALPTALGYISIGLACGVGGVSLSFLLWRWP